MITIRKISTRTLGALIIDLWEKGVDFIDIHGSLGDERDTLGVSFSKSYMHEDAVNNFDDMFSNNNAPEQESSPEKTIQVKLSDEDLNQLL